MQEALLLGDKSLLQRVQQEDSSFYLWRYAPSGLRGESAELRTAAEIDAVKPEVRGMNDIIRRIQRISEADRVLNEILGWNNSHPESSVFELLADQLRVLPTTPAWKPVSAAIANIGVAQGMNRRSGLVRDERTVREFLEMLDENAEAVVKSLVMAAFCVGAGDLPDEETQPAIVRCVSLLSAGLSFADQTGAGICSSIFELERQVTAEASAAPLLPNPTLQLDDPFLAAQVEAARIVGKTNYARLNRVNKSEQAWTNLQFRMNSVSMLEEVVNAGIPTLAEFVAAAARVGPWRVLGIDLRTTTLSQWTTAVLVASGITREPVAPMHQIPSWIYGPALERLGSTNLTSDVRDQLVEWLGEKRKMTGDGLTFFQVWQLGSVETTRFALCITNQKGPMRQWASHPSTGLTFVVTGEQAQQLISRGLFGALRLPTVIAAGDTIDDVFHTLKVPKAALPWIRRITVLSRIPRSEYPRDTVFDPATPDEVLEFATLRPIEDTRTEEEVESVRSSINVYVVPRPKARTDSEPVAFWALEVADGSTPLGAEDSYPTQAAAIEDARRLGYRVLVARGRISLNAANPDHWRSP